MSTLRPFLLPACLLLGCGGGSGRGSADTLRVEGSAASILVGSGARFTASFPDGARPAVTFRIREGDAGGRITPEGLYTAPPQPGTYHIQARLASDPGQVAETPIQVRPYAAQTRRLPDAPDAFDLGTVTPLPDGQLLVAGGRGLHGPVRAEGQRYDPVSGTFSPAGTLATPRYAHTASLLPDGGVLIAGGDDFSGAPDPYRPALATSERWDPTARAFRPGPALTVPRFHHVATTLADGRIFLSGGLQIAGSTGFGASPNTEVYDPATGTFIAGPRMVEMGRWLHTATLLADGRVLLVGGRATNCTTHCPVTALASAELYDPAAGTFTATGSLGIARYRHTATRLADGRVLILGGETTEDLGTGTDQVHQAEIYDPATGTFAPFALTLPRGTHTATPLGDGRILLMGGERLSGVPTTSTELLDPLTGRLTPGPELAETHLRAHALRLPSGEVLLLGGSNGYQPTQAMEIFR